MIFDIRRIHLSLGCAALAAGLAIGCATDETGSGGKVPMPDSFTVAAVSIAAVRLEWFAAEETNYQVERRVSLAGAFHPIELQLPDIGSGRMIQILDTDVVPGTFYGYRLRAESRLGETSRYTPVKGTKTPPSPGVHVETRTSGNVLDPDGYTLLIAGPGSAGDTVTAAIGTNDNRTFQPLPAGDYTVTLTRITDTCARTGGPSRTTSATVDDAGLLTVDSVQFLVSCVDPTRGLIRGQVTVTGGGNNGVGFTLDLEGIANGQPVLTNRTVPANGGTAHFDNLVPGTYQVTISDVSSGCTLNGSATVEFIVLALDELDALFDVTCLPPQVDTTRSGYKLRGSWAQTSPSTVSYSLVLDLTTFDDPAIPGNDDILVISALTSYDQSKLTFTGTENVAGSPLQNQTSNEVAPGVVAWLNVDTDPGPAIGSVGVVVLNFSVVGGATGTLQPVTSFQAVDDVQSENGTDLRANVVIIDRPLTLGGGSGADPIAEGNGPYNGMVGNAIAFSSAGSAAAVGRTLTSYHWGFGDGTTSAQASPSKTYSAAGSYTAALTVTDDLGATATDPVAVTVNSPGGGSGYVLRGAWGPVAAGQTTYTLTYDMTQRDDPAIPGLDDVFVISGVTQFDNTKLSYVSSSNVSGSLLQNQGSNLVSAGNVAWFNADTDPGRATGSVGVIRLTFNVLGGATGSVTPATSFQAVDDVQSENGVDLKPNTTIQDGVLSLGGGGGPAPPTAEANGPYNANLGTPISFSSAGSAPAAGRTLVSFAWSFGDGTTSTQASPVKTYAAAGVYPVTLTVTDDLGNTDSDQTTAVIAVLPSGPVWRNAFSAVNPADSMTTLTMTLDLTADVAQTPGQEALASFVVDSVKWNPAVLQYRGYSWLNGNFGSVVTSSGTGRLTVVTGTVGPGNTTGVVGILTIRFQAIGAPGVSSSSLTDLGPLIGTAATGNFDYLGLTNIVEATVTVP